MEKLDPGERKFVKELEEGGDIYTDEDLWTSINAKRKPGKKDPKIGIEQGRGRLTSPLSPPQSCVTGFIIYFLNPIPGLHY